MKPASHIVSFLLGIIALAHLARLVLHTEVTIGGAVVPMWVSIIGCPVAAALSILVFREARARMA